MIPENISLNLLIATISALFLSTLFFLLFGLFSFKRRVGRSYSFFSDFPFELFDGMNDGLKTLSRVFGFLSILFDLLSAFFLISAFVSFPQGILYLSLFGAVLHAGRSVLSFFLFLLPARYNKEHILVLTLYFVGSALSMLLEGFFLVRYGTGVIGTTVLGYIIMVLGTIDLVLMANPRFASWARLTKESTEKGEVIIKRPKFFLLAYTEWLGFLLDVVGAFLLLFGFLLLFM